MFVLSWGPVQEKQYRYEMYHSTEKWHIVWCDIYNFDCRCLENISLFFSQRGHRLELGWSLFMDVFSIYHRYRAHHASTPLSLSLSLQQKWSAQKPSWQLAKGIAQFSDLELDPCRTGTQATCDLGRMIWIMERQGSKDPGNYGDKNNRNLTALYQLRTSLKFNQPSSYFLQTSSKPHKSHHFLISSTTL